MNTTLPTRTATRTLGMVFGACAAAATLVLAVSPAWVPQQAHDALRVVELPRVVIIAQRDRSDVALRTVELPRVVITGQREPHPAMRPVASGSTGVAQPVLSRLPY